MSYSRITNTLDSPSFYDYLTMSVEDAEYPTAVPLLFGMLMLMPVIYSLDKLTGFPGLFSESHHSHHRSLPFFEIDGAERKCDDCQPGW